MSVDYIFILSRLLARLQGKVRYVALCYVIEIIIRYAAGLTDFDMDIARKQKLLALSSRNWRHPKDDDGNWKDDAVIRSCMQTDLISSK